MVYTFEGKELTMMDLMQQLFEAEEIQHELEAELAAINEEISMLKLIMAVLSDSEL